jgi:hypothetical protein
LTTQFYAWPDAVPGRYAASTCCGTLARRTRAHG